MYNGENSLKVLIVEPSSIIRSGLSVTLKRLPGYWIQPIEINSIENLEHVLELNKPDVLIINPSYWGYVDMTKVRASFAAGNLKIVALSSNAYSDVLLNKYDEVISIYDKTEQIKDKFNKLFDAQSTEEEATESDTLSSREKEILVLVVKGLTNKEIAQKLFLSTHTIITHRRNIARKLEIHSTAGLTVYAIVNKLIELDDIKNNFTL